MPTAKQLKELSQTAKDAHENEPRLHELLRSTAVQNGIQRIKPRYHKTRDEDFTGEDRERLHRKLHTPYGL